MIKAAKASPAIVQFFQFRKDYGCDLWGHHPEDFFKEVAIECPEILEFVDPSIKTEKFFASIVPECSEVLQFAGELRKSERFVKEMTRKHFMY